MYRSNKEFIHNVPSLPDMHLQQRGAPFALVAAFLPVSYREGEVMETECSSCPFEDDEPGCMQNINDCRVLKRTLKNFDIKECDK